MSEVRVARRRVCRFRQSIHALLVSVTACSAATQPDAARDAGQRAPDGLLGRPALQAVVDAGVRRDGPALATFLADMDPIVRARAAYTLAAVQHPSSLPELIRLLDDADPRVRADAAFALGTFEDDAETAAALLRALAREGDDDGEGDGEDGLDGPSSPRTLVLEALGRTGDEAALTRLVERSAGRDARGYALALFGFGRRGLGSAAAAPLLLSLAGSADTVTQEIAAITLSAPRAAVLWGVDAASLRPLLDTAGAGRPAAGALITALARFRDDDDLPRFLDWLRRGERWRTRLQAAHALAAWSDRADVRAALVRALDDTSAHVGITAARELAESSRPDVEQLRTWVARNGDRAAVAAELIPTLARAGDTAFVRSWARAAAAAGQPEWIAFAGYAAASDTQSLDALLAGLESADRRTRYAAAGALARRLSRQPAGAPDRDRIAAAVSDALDSWGPFATGSDLRGLLAVLDATAADESAGANALHTRAAAHAHPGVRGGSRVSRAATGLADSLASDPPVIDWNWLGARGTHPRLRFETARGTFVAQLDVEAAPLTTYTILRFVEEGRYDRLTFHRVEANYILQSGDFDRSGGGGGPDAAIRTEPTRIRFLRGTIGMASAGRDTEGSQFFITHGASPSLDGRYTAFGRIVRGLDVADAITQGDTLIRVTVDS